MAELFGNRADFAIEAGVEPDHHTGSTIWGHMCVWCRSVPLGDLDDRYCGLYPAFNAFAWRAENLDSLWDNELTGLDDVATWNFLDGMLYGYHGDVEIVDDRTLEQMRQDWRRWARFNFLTNWGEQFDGYKSFLLAPPGDSVRVLSRRLPEDMGRGVSVSRVGFLDTTKEFVRWFRAESRRLGVPAETDQNVSLG